MAAVAENFDEIDFESIQREVHARLDDIAMLYGQQSAKQVASEVHERWCREADAE